MLILAAIPVGAATVSKTIYVSTTGSDSWYGTYEKPYKTITKAIGKALAGDTICLRGGTYKQKTTITDKQGTSSLWITIKPYGTEKPIIDASGLSGSYDGIFFLKGTCRYIRITGIELKNANNHGMFLYGSYVNYIRIDNCVIHDCQSSGIYCYNSKNIEFDNNIIYNVNKGRAYDYSGSPQEAISFSNVQGFNIHHNTLSKYGKEGIDAKSGSSYGEIHHNIINTTLSYPAYLYSYNHIGIYIDGYSQKAYNIKVYCNKIVGSGGDGISIGPENYGGSTEELYIYNNIIDISSDYRGIDSCYDYTWKNVYIFCNTIRTKDGTPIRIFPSASKITNLVIKNNIFVSNEYYLIHFQKMASTSTTKYILSNNLYYRTSGTPHNKWYNGEDKTWGASYILKNPLLTANLHLTQTSPAVNKGTTISILTDYDGQIRNICDIGADEYV